jgi:hemoglobin
MRNDAAAAEYQSDSFTANDIAALVYNFYADIENDQLLRPVFMEAIGPNWDYHLMRIVSFWCTVVLKTRGFRGNVLERHMRIPDLKVEHFARWLSLWHGRTLRTFPAEHAALLQRTAETIAKTIFSERFGYIPAFVYLNGNITIEHALH